MASVAIADSRPGDDAWRLYEDHSEWLLRYCTRQLRDRRDAEDAVQTTFLYAFRALRRGVVPDCESAWLTTIARNVCHSQRRTNERHREDAAELDLDRIGLAQPDLEEVGFLDDVRAALASLPENQRRALVLREWHGVGSNEIAADLHLSEAATNALLFRARRSFATALSASRRSVTGLNVAVLLDQLRAWLKSFLGGAAAKAAVATTAVGVAVGGVVLEQRVDGGGTPAPVSPPAAQLDRQASVTSPAPTFDRREPNPRRGTRSNQTRAGAASTSATSSVPDAAPADETDVGVTRPPGQDAAPSALPPSAGAPDPAPPAPAPPVDPPLPMPIDLPPIPGEEPPVELPPPVDELLPPIEVPPVPPLPELELPLP